MNPVSTLALQLIFARVHTRRDRRAVMQVCRRWRECGRRYAFPPVAYMAAAREHAYDTMCELWTHSREWLACTHEAELLCLQAAVLHTMPPHVSCLACNHLHNLVHMIMRKSKRRASLLEWAISCSATASYVRWMLPYVPVTQKKASHWLTLASDAENADMLHTLMADTRVLDPCDCLSRLIYCAALHDQGHLVSPLLGQRRYDAKGIRSTFEAHRLVAQLYEQYPWTITTQELALLWAAKHNAVNVAARALVNQPVSLLIVEQAIDMARHAGHVHICQLIDEAAVRNADSTA